MKSKTFSNFTLRRIGLQKSCRIDNVAVPNLTVYENSDDYRYVVDNNTGVVYLEFCSAGAYGITIMLNPDGKPIMCDQLGL